MLLLSHLSFASGQPCAHAPSKTCGFCSHPREQSPVFAPSIFADCGAAGCSASTACHSVIGYTVTKKLGNAVVRNSVKRRLRAAITPLLAAHGKTGVAYVVIARTGVVEMDFATLTSELQWALKRVHGMLQPKPPAAEPETNPTP